METHNKNLNNITVQGSINSYKDAIRELQEKIRGDYYKKRNDALKEAMSSCGYRYEGVLHELELNRRFILRCFRYVSSCNEHKDYVLYDSLKQRAFVLITENTEPSPILESKNLLKTSTAFLIHTHKNKEVPFNYHR